MNRFEQFSIVFLACTASLSAQQGIGAKYGSREPRTCASMKAPAKGVLSPEQARQYLGCGMEGLKGDMLYLLEDLKVEIGKGMPFKELGSIHRPGNADTEGLVYQIRGSYKQYQCSVQSRIPVIHSDNFGKNCNIYDSPKASGSCYRDNFGEWQCSMLDLSNNNSGTLHDQPAPK